MPGTFPFTGNDSSVLCRTEVMRSHYSHKHMKTVVIKYESPAILLSIKVPLRDTYVTVCACVCLFAQECGRCLRSRCPWTCPWPPISTGLFALCRDAPISIKPVPALTCQQPLWATDTPLLHHLSHQDPGSSLQMAVTRHLIIERLQIMRCLPLIWEVGWFRFIQFVPYTVIGDCGWSSSYSFDSISTHHAALMRF